MPGSAILQTGPGEPWLPSAQLQPDDLTQEAEFGDTVDLAGETLAVGAPGERAIFVFTRSDESWMLETKLLPSGSGGGFGRMVAINEAGTTIVAGARGESATYVYEKGEGAWAQTARLAVEDTSCFGRSVAIDEPRIAVGAPCKASAVHLYERTDSGWSITDVIEGSGRLFGWSVGLDGSFVSASRINEPVSVFQQEQGTWIEEARFPVPETASGGSGFGLATSFDNGTLAVGSPAAAPAPAQPAPTGTGAVYVYTRGAGGWNSPSVLVPGDFALIEPPSGIRFGFSVDVDEDRILVGAPRDDIHPGFSPQPVGDNRDLLCLQSPQQFICQYPGAAYLYLWSSDGWMQETKLTSPDSTPVDLTAGLGGAGETDWFGSGVGLDGTMVAVGAPFSDASPAHETGGVHTFVPLSEVELP